MKNHLHNAYIAVSSTRPYRVSRQTPEPEAPKDSAICHVADPAQITHLSSLGSWIVLGGLLLAATGASFAPWVDRAPAALVLTAPDMAEFVKFLPEVRNGTLAVHRLLFLLPLFVATGAVPVLVTARRIAYPGWVRWPILVMTIPLSLALLPPVWSPPVLLSAEFGLQTIGCSFCLSLVIVSRWLGRMPLRPVAVLLAPLSLAAPALALWQFFVVREAITRAYASSIDPGWGAWATLVGFALTIIGAIRIVHDP
jgi:hypothetical protein